MSDLQWWLIWVVVAGHIVWSAMNWWMYLDVKRIRREAEDMLQWHEVKWGDR